MPAKNEPITVASMATNSAGVGSVAGVDAVDRDGDHQGEQAQQEAAAGEAERPGPACGAGHQPERAVEQPFDEDRPGHPGQDQPGPGIAIDVGLERHDAERQPLQRGGGDGPGRPPLSVAPVRQATMASISPTARIHRADAEDPADIEPGPVRPAPAVEQLPQNRKPVIMKKTTTPACPSRV